MPPPSSSHPTVDGSFEVTLARALTINKERLQIQEAVSQYPLWLSELSPHRRLVLAMALQWEFHQRVSWAKHDEQSLETLQQQYNLVRSFVTPIYHLPAEILTEIFFIDFEAGQSPIRLMLVCRNWYITVEAMASVWQSLKLGTWTTLDKVQQFMRKAWRLSVVIHTDEDMERREGVSGAYTGLALVADNAFRWRRVTINSLPHAQLGDAARQMPSFVGLPLIKELKYLNVASQAECSPLLDPLLENIGTAAVGNLSILETTSFHTVRRLIQPAYTQLFQFLTSLKVDVRKTGDLVDLLPLLSRIEVLELANISLPSYKLDLDLPLTRSLRLLRLKAVSVQWMAGRHFLQLQSCSITSPAFYSSLVSDIDFPMCTELELRNWNMGIVGQLRTPTIDSLAIRSNEWTPLRGSKQVIQFCRAGLGLHLRPSVLHLAILCKEDVLLSVLELLPALQELQLDLARPSGLGRHFFMTLLAKPTDDLKDEIDREWDSWPKNRENWKASMCPALRRLEVKFGRWFRQTDQLDILPPLMAMAWSRKKTKAPLRSFHLRVKGDNAQWKVIELHTLRLHQDDIVKAFDIPELQSPKQSEFLMSSSFFEACFTAITSSVMDLRLWHLKLDDLRPALPVFGRYFHQLNILRIHKHQFYPYPGSTLDILPDLYRLEELELSSVYIPSYSINVDLPLVQTLLRLSLHSTTLTWMNGRVFPRLKRFCLRGNCVSPFCPWAASLPVCKNIRSDGINCHLLPSILRVPILDELEMCAPFPSGFGSKTDGGSGTFGLLPTHILRFYADSMQSNPLIQIIAPQVEMEVLMVQSNWARTLIELLTALGKTTTCVDVSTLPSAYDTDERNSIYGEYWEDAGVLGKNLRNPICANLRQLALRVLESSGWERQEIRQLCKQMMVARGRSGKELWRCCIWWGAGNWAEEPSMVFVMTGEGVVVER
jgi:hypothetical protein